MSPAISFSGEGLARGPFWRQILSGDKTCTTRRARRKGRPEPGQVATLYWKQRQPMKRLEDGLDYGSRVEGREGYWSKPIHKIGEAYITSVRRIHLKDLWINEEYAIAEGFSGLAEMHRWWIPEIEQLPRGQLTMEMLPLLVYRILDQLGPMDLIRWQFPLKDTTELEGKS